MDSMSDSACYEGSTLSQSDASLSQQIFSLDIPPPPQLLQQQTTAMPSTNIITCRLCQKIFFNPVVFPCGHTFCLACSEKWRKRQRVCPQDGCGKPLGESVPNLLAKEAVISHHEQKIMKVNQQQELASQLAAALQQREETATGGHQENVLPIEKSPAYESPPLRQKVVTFDRQEATQSQPSTTRYFPNRAFVRGAQTTEIHQKPSQPVFANRRSLRTKFFGRPKEVVSGTSSEDFALGKRRTEEKWDVWMGDEQQQESRESSDLAFHPMKKDKSLWSKTKFIFSSNKVKK